MDYRKRGSNAQGAFPTQGASRLGTVREEEEKVD